VTVATSRSHPRAAAVAAVVAVGRFLYACIGAAVTLYFALRSALPGGAQAHAMYRERLGQWSGFDPAPGDRRGWVWVHAASVGEVGAAAGLVAALRERGGDLRILLTASTAAGWAAAARLPVDESRYLPVDYTPIIKRILARFRPLLFVSIETEIWPALFGALQAAGVATAIVSARISDRSWPRYRWIAALLETTLAGLALVAARDRLALDRYVALGVRADRAKVLGDLKLDGVPQRRGRTAPDRLAALWAEPADQRTTLVAISTHVGESAVLLDAYEEVRARHPGVHMVIAPRHPDRADDLYRALERRGIRHARWSLIDRAVDRPSVDVLVLDTLGQVREFLESPLGAFVGGTFDPVGGHNPLEPAAYGLPVVCGPHVDKVRSQVDGLVACGALRIVDDAQGLARQWLGWLEDRRAATEAGERARAFVVAGSGVARATADELLALVPAAARAGERRS